MKKFALKARLRSALARLYYYSGGFALHLRWRRRTRNVLILTFHRVLPEASPVLQNRLSLRSIIVTQENFQRLLAFLGKHFAFAALPHLAAGKIAPGQAACILTFDDGYHDFARHAWPVLRRMNLTATMFLPTALVDTAHNFWWDEVFHLAMKLERISAEGLAPQTQLLLRQIAATPFAARAALVYQLIDHLQGWPEEDVNAFIKRLAGREGCNAQEAQPENRLMTWVEIATLHAEGAHFGSHTRHHVNLAAASPERLAEEVASSKDELARKLNAPVDAFAFPGGHISEAALRSVAQAGYALACSTKRGFNEIGENQFRLRRINVWDGMLQDFRGRFSPAECALNLMRASL